VIAVQRVLARATWQKLVAGRTADEVYPEAVADADRAFALLQTGTGDATEAGSGNPATSGARIRLSRWIGAPRLIRCIPVPGIRHQARLTA
jgi:hypothetical protein